MNASLGAPCESLNQRTLDVNEECKTDLILAKASAMRIAKIDAHGITKASAMRIAKASAMRIYFGARLLSPFPLPSVFLRVAKCLCIL